MNVEDILAPMRAELSRTNSMLGMVDLRRRRALAERRDALITALRINEEFVRAALRAKEKAHA